MPQFIEFPTLPEDGVSALIACFGDMPGDGESFKAFRRRLKSHKLWSRERLDVLLRFMQMATGDWVVPSVFARGLGGEAPHEAILSRLWAVNPLLFATVVERLTERIHSANELHKYIDSFAYPGARIPGPDLRAWLRLADGAGLFKAVGIRMGLNDDAHAAFAKRLERFDVEEFLEDDVDEAPVIPAGAPAQPVEVEPVDTAQDAPAHAVAEPVSLTPAVRSSPVPAPAPPAASPWQAVLPTGQRLAPAAFATAGVFDAGIRADVVDRMQRWQTAPAAVMTPADFGLASDAFREDGERALFELAVAAHLRFGTPEPVRALASLREAGVIEALHTGTPFRGSTAVDAGAVMAASLVARRLAQAPDLMLSIDRADDADAVFELLSAAFEGLFTLELFWMIRAMTTLGVVRRGTAGGYAALPTRTLRDVLFRQGFLTTPYATELAALQAAAQAASPFGAQAEQTLAAFAHASRCAYACPHRARCDVPCRERADRA